MALCWILKTYLLISIAATAVCCTEVSVQTPAGTIYGVSDVKTRQGHQYVFSSFFEIPYAEPPIGNRRFEKPVRKAVFETPFYANISENIACHAPMTYPSHAEFKFQEDCLLLSIFVPGDLKLNNSFPVMLYIHGGGLAVGSQSSFIAPLFAAKSRTILVTINYRLNIFGFISNEKAGLKGNYGLWDQHMAIQWVHDNIRAFGGDPNHVTLIGNSAGSASVIYQALYPGNKNLFQNIIAESGSPAAFWAYDKNYKESFEKLSKRQGCTRDNLVEVVRCLREQSANILSADYLHFAATNDHDFLFKYPDELFDIDTDKHNQVFRMFGSINMIIGMNTNDGCYAFPNYEDFHFFRQSFKWFTKELLRLADQQSNPEIVESITHEYIGHLNDSDSDMIKQGFLDVEMDTAFTLSVTLAAKVHSRLNGKGNTYFYVFDHRPSFSNLPSWAKGANHADELPFVFWFPDSVMRDFFDRNERDPSNYLSPGEFELSDSIINYWVQFAKTGDPNGQLATWPAYTPDTQKYLKFQANVDPFPIGSHFRRDKIKFWLELIPGLLKTNSVTAVMPQYSLLLIVCVLHNSL